MYECIIIDPMFGHPSCHRIVQRCTFDARARTTMSIGRVLVSLRRLFSWSRIETASAAGAGIIFRVFEITSTRRSDLGWTRVRTEYSFIIEDSVHDDMRTRIETRILQWRQLTT